MAVAVSAKLYLDMQHCGLLVTWGRFHVAFLEAKNTFLALGTLS